MVYLDLPSRTLEKKKNPERCLSKAQGLKNHLKQNQALIASAWFSSLQCQAFSPDGKTLALTKQPTVDHQGVTNKTKNEDREKKGLSSLTDILPLAWLKAAFRQELEYES